MTKPTKWFKVCLLLCCVGFLKEFRPNEMFGVEYLVGPWQNITNEEVMQLVFPVWSYCYPPMLVIAFLVTDYLLYKPVVVSECLSYVIFHIILIWGYGITAQQVAEVFYASATASAIAYSTYIYAQTPKDKFQVVTSYTQAAAMTGTSLSSLVGQILISTKLCDYAELNYISLAFVTAASIVAFFLPSAKHSIYFHRNDPDNPEIKSLSPWRLLWTDFTTSYSNRYTLKWSIWWALAMCGYVLVITYIQALWDEVDGDPLGTGSAVWNGAVEAISSLIGALAVLGVGYAGMDWSVHGELAIIALSLFQCIVLFVSGSMHNIWVAYAGYILFCVSYQMLLVIASAEVAKGLKRESYGLVFGFNTFAAMTLDLVMTVIFVSPAGFALSAQQQFQVYGGYFGVLGTSFLAIKAYNNA